MKVRNVFLCCALFAALCITGRATAQDTVDNFLGSLDPNIPWTWTVSGNNPENTEDPNNYSFSDNSLIIDAYPGTLYSIYNNAHNIPSLVILGVPDDGNWYVETAVSTDWSTVTLDTYIHAGLLFFTDADNYFQYYNNRSSPMPLVQVSSGKEFAAMPSYGGVATNSWDPTTDYVKLRVEAHPDTGIHFLFDNTGNGFQEAFGSPISSGDVFDFLSSLVGKQVGLETDTGGDPNFTPFSFNYFATNLAVVPQ